MILSKVEKVGPKWYPTNDESSHMGIIIIDETDIVNGLLDLPHGAVVMDISVAMQLETWQIPLPDDLDIDQLYPLEYIVELKELISEQQENVGAARHRVLN